ncbi:MULTISPECIES: hypothetical protein [unclassified Sphingomonas]|nr:MULTISPECIES: hypothetical protein [unclassified Sphingomonas]
MTKEMDFTPGRFAIVQGYSGLFSDARLRPAVFRIDSETPKTIRQLRSSRNETKQKLDVMATFADEQEARQFVQTVDGIRGEMKRRESAARAWAFKALDHKLAQVSA